MNDVILIVMMKILFEEILSISPEQIRTLILCA